MSRRDLFGIFGRGTKGFRESIQKNLPDVSPGAANPPPPRAPRTYARKLRPRTETISAIPDGQGGWLADLRRQPIGMGGSLRVEGPGLPEPLLLVRVRWDHVAVVSGECPVDGSDLLWSQDGDRVQCPSCVSRWRLDGELKRRPADCRIASYLAEETAGLVRIRAFAR